MNKNSIKIRAMTLAFSAVFLTACDTTQLKETGDLIIKEYEKQQNAGKASLVPTTDEMVAAIKQSLQNGSANAVSLLGADGGFSKSQYKIPLPQNLQDISSKMRTYGLGSYVDEFETSMNKAAEKAVPEAADVFGDMIKNMSVEDALSLIKGNDDAVTQYFKKTKNTELEARFMPIVKSSTDQVGVTSLYTKLNDQAKVFGVELPDVNQYILGHATGALYDELAVVEKDIRQDPVKRTTEILQKVFGYYAK